MPLDTARTEKVRQFLRTVTPTGRELLLGEDELIVSKTDPRGLITYANSVFLRLAGLTEEEALGAPHSVIRHPDMPRAVFALMWQRIAAGQEVFAYVVNLSKAGDHYWVLAHVTPSFGPGGAISGYHSNRRAPARRAVAAAAALYAELRRTEAAAGDGKAGATAGLAHLDGLLKQKGVSYDEFFFAL